MAENGPPHHPGGSNKEWESIGKQVLCGKLKELTNSSLHSQNHFLSHNKRLKNEWIFLGHNIIQWEHLNSDSSCESKLNMYHLSRIKSYQIKIITFLMLMVLKIKLLFGRDKNWMWDWGKLNFTIHQCLHFFPPIKTFISVMR